MRDLENRIYADPDKIHDIDHVGEFFDVVGPHLSEPSPQRTPVLFQAGSSEQGREFAARNAEAIFIVARSPGAVGTNIDDVRARAVRAGRDPEDVLFFQGLSFIVGGTEEEAWRKAAEIEEHASPRGYAAHMGGSMGVDLAEIPLDTPIGEVENYNSRGFVKWLREEAADRDWTFGDALAYRAINRVVGTPEQIADRLQEWADAGVDGINVTYYTTPGSFVDFIDGVIPVLQERGLAQREYRPGTLREKLTDGADGPRLNERHPRVGSAASAWSAPEAQAEPSSERLGVPSASAAARPAAAVPAVAPRPAPGPATASRPRRRRARPRLVHAARRRRRSPPGSGHGGRQHVRAEERQHVAQVPLGAQVVMVAAAHGHESVGLPRSASTGTWSSRFLSAPVSDPRYTGVASTTAEAQSSAATTRAVSSSSSAGGLPSANAMRAVARSISSVRAPADCARSSACDSARCSRPGRVTLPSTATSRGSPARSSSVNEERKENKVNRHYYND